MGKRNILDIILLNSKIELDLKNKAEGDWEMHIDWDFGSFQISAFKVFPSYWRLFNLSF